MAKPGTTVAIVAAQYAYMVSSDFESPEVRYALGPYTPLDPYYYLYMQRLSPNLKLSLCKTNSYYISHIPKHT